MAKVNNYPYTNMVYQNVDWIVDEVEGAKATAERAEQTVQAMDSRVNTLETDVNTLKTDMNNAEAQLAAHELAINQDNTEISGLRSQLNTVEATVTDINDAQLPAVRSTAVRAEEKANTLETSKVDKTADGYRVYGTNSTGEQSTYAIDVTNELRPVSVVVRAANGTVRTPAPVLNNDAANKQYVDEAIIDKAWNTVIDDNIIAALDTNSKTYDVQIDKCKELKITSIIDNGNTNSTVYDSANLEVSVNGGSLFSIAGAVPNEYSSVEKTEDFTNMYTWDWSFFGFGEQKVQILTGKKFTRESLLEANVSITSYLSNDTFNVTSVNESATSVDAPGYKGYKVTFQKTGDPATLRYGVLATQVYSAAPDLQVGMLFICSFDAGGDISDLYSGKWTYTDKVATHKIATGTLDMKYISSDMAETETSGSGNRDNISDGTVIPTSNIKHYALHPANNTISTIQIKLSNGVIREGTRVIIQYHR